MQGLQENKYIIQAFTRREDMKNKRMKKKETKQEEERKQKEEKKQLGQECSEEKEQGRGDFTCC